MLLHVHFTWVGYTHRHYRFGHVSSAYVLRWMKAVLVAAAPARDVAIPTSVVEVTVVGIGTDIGVSVGVFVMPVAKLKLVTTVGIGMVSVTMGVSVEVPEKLSVRVNVSSTIPEPKVVVSEAPSEEG